MATDDTKEAAIRGLHTYKEQLLLEIEQKQADLRSVERSIELLSGNGHKAPTQDNGQRTLTFSGPPTSRYSGLKNQAACRLFLQENADQWWKASQVAKELIRRGITASSKHWNPAITGALNRLADKGIAIKEKRAGVFRYKFSPADK
ncbi:MAG: hypothetical protein JXN61_07025 [Sedimentisphaerales bacterium]|nr:hypothetical protein [Sedimentisphaerales bacterium]